MVTIRRFVLQRTDGTRVAAIPAAAGESLFDAATRAGQPIVSRCRGSLICALCRVTIASGDDLVEPAHDEESARRGEDASATTRLACQLRHRAGVTGDVVVSTPYW